MKPLTSIISKGFGRFASYAFPSAIQQLINRVYCKIFSIDLTEFEPVESYSTLNALFTRSLRIKREFDESETCVISPCDAKIMACGTMQDEIALQIKGMYYSVDELLSNNIDADAKGRIANGLFVNCYLSPRDYHHYHLPINTYVQKIVHIPGKLLPVNLPSLRKHANLFIQNERIVVQCADESGRLFFMILVGALNVGQMTLVFEPHLHEKINAHTPTVIEYDNLYLSKGDELGMFQMGSTVVLLFEPKSVTLEVAPAQSVQYTQRIATLN